MQNGTMVWWRPKASADGGEWRFGYVTHLSDGLVRMGCWNGDAWGGKIVSEREIETKSYN